MAPSNNDLVHHWTMLLCNSKYQSVYLSTHSAPYPGNCYDSSFTNSANPVNTWQTIQGYCYQLSVAGTGGSEVFSL